MLIYSFYCGYCIVVNVMPWVKLGGSCPVRLAVTPFLFYIKFNLERSSLLSFQMSKEKSQKIGKREQSSDSLFVDYFSLHFTFTDKGAIRYISKGANG